MTRIELDAQPKPLEFQSMTLDIPKEIKGLILDTPEDVKIGIDETKDVLLFAVLFANAINKTFADGKVTLADLPNFFNVVLKLPAALNGINKVPSEINDLDENELKTLLQIVKDNLGLQTDQVKVVLQKSLDFVFAAYNLIIAIRTS